MQTTQDNSIGITYIEPLVPLQDFQDFQVDESSIEPAGTVSVELPPDEPDYAAFMVPRGLTRDHIRGESSK